MCNGWKPAKRPWRPSSHRTAAVKILSCTWACTSPSASRSRRIGRRESRVSTPPFQSAWAAGTMLNTQCSNHLPRLCGKRSVTVVHRTNRHTSRSCVSCECNGDSHDEKVRHFASPAGAAHHLTRACAELEGGNKLFSRHSG